MKTKLNQLANLTVTLAMVIVVGLSVSSIAQAQTTLTGLKIPFDFYVGSQHFAPGDYTVRVTGEYIKLADESGHSAFVLTNRVTRSEWKNIRSGLLVFNHYDNAYFLSEVWREGYSNGNQLMKTSTEIEIARNSTAKEPVAFRASR